MKFVPKYWASPLLLWMSHWLLTNITEQDREEDEAVCGPQQHYGQEHPKVEDLEDLRLGQRQD